MPAMKRYRSLLFEHLESRTVLSTLYVANTGDDASGDGSAANPFATIQHAADLVQPGDTVDVRPGQYAGFIIGWDTPLSGTAAAPITFQGEPGATIISRNNKTPDGIDLEGGDNYVNITGFTVNNADSSITRAGIRVAGSDHVNVIGNTTTGNGTWGIFTSFSNFTLIQNNITSGSINQHGIYVSNSADHPSVIGNTIFGNAQCGIHLNGDLSQGGNGLITNALIANNIIYDNGLAGGSGINGDGLCNSVIENNLLYNNHASGISLYQVDGATGATNNLVVNNTIMMAADGRWAININTGSTGNVVFNNVLFNDNINHGDISIDSSSLPGFTSDHNVLVGLESVDDGTEGLAAWQAGTGQDLHSIPSTPAAVFVSEAGNDFQLSSGSPAINTGVSSFAGDQAPTTDLLGKPRPSGGAFDIGAYESQGPAPTLTLSGAVSVSVGSVYTLTLSSSASVNDGMKSWLINWGDGTTQTVAAGLELPLNGKWVTTAAAAHIYTTSATSVISATATDALGTFTAVNSLTISIGVPQSPPPTLAAIANQTISQGHSDTLTLQGSGAAGKTLAYAAVAETVPYWLKQTYGMYEDAGGYYLNYRHQQEKYLRGKQSADGYSDPNGYWYYILPNGDLYEFTPPYTTAALTGVLVARLGTAVYTDPSLLWNAQNTAVPATLSVLSNALTITPAPTYTGTFEVIASVSDGQGVASRSFQVVVNPPPTLAAVARQTISQGGTDTVTLQGTGASGTVLTYSATAQSLPYWLKQTYGMYEDAGGYYLNYRHQQEKYLRGKLSADGYSDPNGYWYYILPNGDLYEFTPPYTTAALTGVLVAHLGTAVYTDPSLLWNAQNTAVPATWSMANNVLTITPTSTYTGSFEVIASVSDGQASASRSFQVVVNPPPTLAAIPNQAIVKGTTGTVTLQGSGAPGTVLTYSATAQSLPYWLKQTYGMYEDAGGYYLNYRHQQEKYLRGKQSADGYSDPNGYWYYILPNGDLYEFTPPYTTAGLTGVLVARLGTAVYTDPSLLWNAQNTAVPATLSVSSNVLTITPLSTYTGSFVVIAIVSDGQASASKAFTVTVS